MAAIYEKGPVAVKMLIHLDMPFTKFYFHFRHCIFTRPLTDVIVEKLSCPRDIQRKKKREMTSSTSKLYKPFKQSLAELDVPATLGPLIKDSSPKSGF